MSILFEKRKLIEAVASFTAWTILAHYLNVYITGLSPFVETAVIWVIAWLVQHLIQMLLENWLGEKDGKSKEVSHL